MLCCHRRSSNNLHRRWNHGGQGAMAPHFLETIVKTMAKVNKICDWPPHLDICSNTPDLVVCFFFGGMLFHGYAKQHAGSRFFDGCGLIVV